jgi:hypothetical protein
MLGHERIQDAGAVGLEYEKNVFGPAVSGPFCKRRMGR